MEPVRLSGRLSRPARLQCAAPYGAQRAAWVVRRRGRCYTGAAAARTVAQPRGGSLMPLSLQEARALIDAGINKARDMNQRVAIAVVDEAGHVISLDKMDGTS